MKLLKHRTKFEASGAICVVILLIAVSVMAGTRIISDSSDNIKNFITNSNGGVWEATGANIQNAIYDIGNETRGVVYLPGGIIPNDQKIYFTNHTSIIGAGSGNTIINCTSGTTEVFFGDYNKHNFSLEGVTIECNSLSGNPIYCRGCVDFSLIDTEAVNSTSNGMALWHHCKRATVRDFKGYKCSRSGTIGYGFEGFACNNVSDSTFDGIDVSHTINSAGTYTSEYQIDFHTVTNSTIENVHCHDGGGMKVFGEGTWYAEHSTYDGITIANVVIAQAGNTNSLWIKKAKHCIFSNLILRENYEGTGIKIGESYYITINGFDINKTADCGIDIDSDGVACSVIKVGNGIITDTASRGIRLDHADNVTVSNVDIYAGSYNTMITCYDTTFSVCRFMDTPNIGMSVADCHRWKFLGCAFIRNTYAIYTSGTCSNWTVFLCTLDGNSQDFIEISAGDDDYKILFNDFLNLGIRNAVDDHARGTRKITGNSGYNYSNFNHFGDTTNYVNINETGYITLHGDARVERHADINAGTWIKKGLADPGTSTEGLFCTLDFDKATNETVYYTFHIPWRRCENTDIEVQVKWFHDTNASDANKKVMWGFDYVSIETGETVDAVNTSITQLSAGNHNTDAGKLVSTTFTAKIVAGNLANHDTMGLRFYRVGTATGDDLNEDARLISVHLHFTMDKLGEPIG